VTINVYYAPLAVFQTYAFWMTVMHWALPTLVIPAIVGNLISFSPQSHGVQSPTTESPVPFDPLTAAIIRLAAQVAWPFPAFEKDLDLLGLDVLGPRARIFNAAVGLAFAFAEAIAATPQAVAKSLAGERSDRLFLQDSSPVSASVPVQRRALMPHNQPEGVS
jgi:hypothetical protein